MARFYDIDKLQKLCKAKAETVFGDGKAAFYSVVHWLDLLPPAADVVEVVRCRDCIYWDGEGYRGSCETPTNGITRDYTNEDDFCSYGKRRETS